MRLKGTTNVNADSLHLKSLGARIRSEANYLKRTPEALASELNLSAGLVEAVMAGKADLGTAQNLLRAMADNYPISLADIWVDADDTDQGVRLMTAAMSRKSSRVFKRPDKDGALTEYYEYRDTAMSRGAPFKPEWILELRSVEDANPYNPDIAYNNGHFMHQTTFFIGPVNFYWETGGKRYCAEMNTGDSNYITPFVPHSFASRDPNQPGLIIAVTFSGLVGRALRDFIAIGADAINCAAGDLRAADLFHHRLARHCKAESMSIQSLRMDACENGIGIDRAREIIEGAAIPNLREIEILATVLAVRPSDLMVFPLEQQNEVIVKRFRRDAGRAFPDDNSPAYRMTQLARSQHQPYMKGFEIAVLGGGGDSAFFEHCLHQYVYNYGVEPVDLIWEPERSATLQPGDSAYIRPLIRHRFDITKNTGEGRLVAIRVPGQLTDQVLDEYAGFATTGRNRVVAETRRWF